MSASNFAVGEALAKGKSRRGGNLFSEADERDLFPPFKQLAVGRSYGTIVAKLVVNTCTQKSELWVTPIRYSNTTQGHKTTLRHAFVNEYVVNHGCSPDAAYRQVHETSAVNGVHTPRTDPTIAMNVWAAQHTALAEIDRPRIRDATRRGVVGAAQHRVGQALRRLCMDVPLRAVNAGAMCALYEMQQFLDGAAQIADVDELRAAVMGWRGLTTPEDVARRRPSDAEAAEVFAAINARMLLEDITQ